MKKYNENAITRSVHFSTDKFHVSLPFEFLYGYTGTMSRVSVKSKILMNTGELLIPVVSFILLPNIFD